MRKNRFDTGDIVHVAIWADPARYTRESRRAAGLRLPVHDKGMRSFYGGGLPEGEGQGHRVLPRAIRRLFRDPAKAPARVGRNRAKVQRLLAARGEA